MNCHVLFPYQGPGFDPSINLWNFCNGSSSFQTLYYFLRFHTDGSKILHTLLVKHYNDLLERQSSKQGKDEVSYFYVGDVFCKHLGTKYADFQQ